MSIVWSAVARTDSLAIVDALLEVNLATAVDTEQRINETIGQLADFPRLGRPGRVAGTRELVITGTPYIAAYRVRRDMIDIIRVLHGARKWPETF